MSCSAGLQPAEACEALTSRPRTRRRRSPLPYQTYDTVNGMFLCEEVKTVHVDAVLKGRLDDFLQSGIRYRSERTARIGLYLDGVTLDRSTECKP